VKYGSATKPMPGWDLQVLDDDGTQVAPGDIGALV
jgi:propionyl-CoA synthetase